MPESSYSDSTQTPRHKTPLWVKGQHYWVLIKLGITALATVLLLVHLQPVTAMADMSLATDLGPSDMNGTRIQLVFDAEAAVLALLIISVLSVYKPRGLTRHGQKVLAKQQQQAHSTKAATHALGARQARNYRFRYTPQGYIVMLLSPPAVFG